MTRLGIFDTLDRFDGFDREKKKEYLFFYCQEFGVSRLVKLVQHADLQIFNSNTTVKNCQGIGDTAPVSKAEGAWLMLSILIGDAILLGAFFGFPQVGLLADFFVRPNVPGFFGDAAVGVALSQEVHAAFEHIAFEFFAVGDGQVDRFDGGAVIFPNQVGAGLGHGERGDVFLGKDLDAFAV